MRKHDSPSIGEKYIAAWRHRRVWKRAVAVLACFVVAGTIGALTLPAITMNRQECPLEEHQHSGECLGGTKVLSCTAERLGIHQHTSGCFDGGGNVICRYADFVIHKHDENCTDANGKLVCALPEIREHQHDNSCYETAASFESGHQHSENCYQWSQGENLICGQEESVGHQHTDSCHSVVTELTCGLPEEAGHTHEPQCYDENGGVVCGQEERPGHKHGADCRAEQDTIICELEESSGHQHADRCYEQVKGGLICQEEEQEPATVPGEPTLICEKAEIAAHTHKESCFDKDGVIVCDQLEIRAHQHTEACFITEEEPVLLCKLPVHQHTEACGGVMVSVPEIADADSSIVVKAFVVVSGEDVPAAKPRRTAAQAFAVDVQQPGNIGDYLQNAGITINGKPYDGASALNPGEQFQVELKWQLEREQLSETLTYTYKIPDQIVVKDVDQAVLYDENNNRKGVYSIKGGVLTVTYDSVADVNTTTFKLNATWNQDKIGQETTIKWNGKLETPVKFDNSQVSAAKKLLEQKDMPDGSLVGEYAVTVTAKSAVNGISLTDTLTAEKFHFTEGYYEVDGQKYDYRVKQADGSYTYGNFEKTANADGSTTVTFPSFDLPADGTYTVEYGVKLDADDRFELDRYQKPTGLRNTATASYQSGEDTISSTVTVENTYQATDKWLVKKQGDAVADNEAPWTIKVNNAKAYDMGGAVIGDKIETKGVTYKENPVSITGTTKDGEVTTYNPTWVEISDSLVATIAASPNAFDRLFDPNDADGQAAKRELEVAAGVTLTEENISDYIFVGTGKNQFVWISPETGTPTSYEISYYTDTTGAGNAITNSASAGWKQWTVGDVVGGLMQQVGIKKENSGVRQDGDDYFVDWTITLEVPPHRGAIKDVYFYDSMPWHSESGDFDHLAGLNSGQIDFARGEIAVDRVAQIKDLDYLKELTKNAFSVKSDSAAVQQYLNEHSYTTLGHPIVGLVYNWPGAGRNFDVYEGGDVGQLEIIGAGNSWFAGKRMTPAAFGIYLGDLPGTDDTGYTITVNYTTKVDPVWVDKLDGLGQGQNAVELKQRVNENLEVTLAEAYSKYWITHTKAQDTLDKNVVEFDPETRILTYRVEIDPLANLAATPGATYQIKDVLNLPGATYVEDSFKLAIHGEVADNGAITWDQSSQSIFWRSDDSLDPNKYNVPDWFAILFSRIHEARKIPVQLDITSQTNASNQFTLEIHNAENVLALKAPEDKAGMLAPMSLTYQVKLPENAEESGTGTLINNVSLYRQEGAKNPELLDGAKAEFDYSSALHKKLSTAPDGENGYKATFTIDVDKTVKEWPEDLKTFTVQDDMSKSLTADITSIHVYGCGKNGQKVELTEGFTISYDDQAADKNTLWITVSDQSYQQYQIVYDAKLAASEANTTVALSNTASILGTQIKSETVDKDIYVQEQDGSVVEQNFQVKLLKFDAANTAVRLEATFDLYAYENGIWVLKDSGIKTSAEDGTITLKNTDEKAILSKDTWYKLVETDPPKGYIASTTYFHLGQVSGDKPQGVGAFTAIPLDGGTHQVPNYKATLTLRKVDAADNGKLLSGAEFTLYEDMACAKEIGKLTEKSTGIYSFSLENLTAGTTYYLKETKAPAGYRLPGTVYTVTFNAEGKVTVKDVSGNVIASIGNAYRIPNETSYELPQTGGTGTFPYLFSGLALIGAATLIYSNRCRKRKEAK